jgi:hypothetical protein
MLAREEHISRRKMASTRRLSQDEKELRDSVFSMAEMVKVLYEDYLERKSMVQVKASKNNKGKEELKEVPSTSISENTSEVCSEGFSSNFPHSHQVGFGAFEKHTKGVGLRILTILLDTPTTLRGGGGVNECGALFPKTSLLHKNSSISIQHLFITHCCHL